MIELAAESVENIVEKGENVGNYFILSQHCFQKLSFPRVIKSMLKSQTLEC